MLSFLPGWLRGILAFSLVSLHTVFFCTLVYVFALFKIVFPIRALRTVFSQIITGIGELWMDSNAFITRFTQKIEWTIKLPEGLTKNTSYLVLANHQTWNDIVVLHQAFRRKIPFLRFFIKKQLFWVPFLGPAWWAFDFPFMNRFSKEYLEKHPEKKGQDVQNAKKRCRRFRDLHTAILIFPEGTRFTQAKHSKKKSPFKYLLPPKAGGLATVLDVMGDQFDSVLDVTIAYPDGAQSFWGLITGKVKSVIFECKQLPLPKNDYEAIKDWLNQRWWEKDANLIQLA